MEAPHNVCEFQGVCIVADEVKVHRMRYERKMECI
jgi:hypothetical protein